MYPVWVANSMDQYIQKVCRAVYREYIFHLVFKQKSYQTMLVWCRFSARNAHWLSHNVNTVKVMGSKPVMSKLGHFFLSVVHKYNIITN